MRYARASLDYNMVSSLRIKPGIPHTLDNMLNCFAAMALLLLLVCFSLWPRRDRLAVASLVII